MICTASSTASSLNARLNSKSFATNGRSQLRSCHGGRLSPIHRVGSRRSLGMTMLAEALNKQISWSSFTDITGSAGDVGNALCELLASANSEACESWYWRIENHVVVQGSVYDAARPATRVLVAALADQRPKWVRIAVLELLYQILSGAPVPGTYGD